MDEFSRLFGGFPVTAPSKPKPEKGVQIHGRKIDDQYYVRAADIAALLELNEVLLGVAAKLRKADA